MANTGAILAGGAFLKLTLDGADFQNGMKKAQAGLSQFAKNCQTFGNRVMFMSTMLQYPFKVAIDAFSNFDLKMRQVRAITSATAKEMNILSSYARKLGRDTSYTTSQVSDAMVALSRLGMSAKEVKNTTKPVMNLAKATGDDLATSAQIAGNAMKVFGKRSEDMASITDVIVSTVNKSSQTLQEYGEAAFKAGPNFAQTGQDIEEMSASIGILANMGIRGSLAGTALSRSIKQLANPKVQEFLKQYGISAVTAEGNMRSLSSVLMDISKVMSTMGNASRVRFAEEIFDVRGSLAGLPLSVNVKGINDMMAALRNCRGEAERVATEMDAGIYGAIKRLESAFDDLKLEIGSISSEAFLPWINALKEIFNSVRECTPLVKTLISYALQFGAALTVAGVSLGLFGKAKEIFLTMMTPIIAVERAITGAAKKEEHASFVAQKAQLTRIEMEQKSTIAEKEAAAENVKLALEAANAKNEEAKAAVDASNKIVEANKKIIDSEKKKIEKYNAESKAELSKNDRKRSENNKKMNDSRGQNISLRLEKGKNEGKIKSSNESIQKLNEKMSLQQEELSSMSAPSNAGKYTKRQISAMKKKIGGTMSKIDDEEHNINALETKNRLIDEQIKKNNLNVNALKQENIELEKSNKAIKAKRDKLNSGANSKISLSQSRISNEYGVNRSIYDAKEQNVTATGRDVKSLEREYKNAQSEIALYKTKLKETEDNLATLGGNMTPDKKFAAVIDAGRNRYVAKQEYDSAIGMIGNENVNVKSRENALRIAQEEERVARKEYETQVMITNDIERRKNIAYKQFNKSGSYQDKVAYTSSNDELTNSIEKEFFLKEDLAEAESRLAQAKDEESSATQALKDASDKLIDASDKLFDATIQEVGAVKQNLTESQRAARAWAYNTGVKKNAGMWEARHASLIAKTTVAEMVQARAAMYAGATGKAASTMRVAGYYAEAAAAKVAASATLFLKGILDTIKAHPVMAAMTVFTTVVNLVSNYFDKASENARKYEDSLAGVASETERAKAREEERFKSEKDSIGRLIELGKMQSLDSDQKAEAKEIIDELSKAYGNLGVSIDMATGKINGQYEAYSKLNDIQKKKVEQNIKKTGKQNTEYAVAVLRNLAGTFAGNANKNSVLENAALVNGKSMFARKYDPNNKLFGISQHTWDMSGFEDAMNTYSSEQLGGVRDYFVDALNKEIAENGEDGEGAEKLKRVVAAIEKQIELAQQREEIKKTGDALGEKKRNAATAIPSFGTTFDEDVKKLNEFNLEFGISTRNNRTQDEVDSLRKRLEEQKNAVDEMVAKIDSDIAERTAIINDARTETKTRDALKQYVNALQKKKEDLLSGYAGTKSLIEGYVIPNLFENNKFDVAEQQDALRKSFFGIVENYDARRKSAEDEKALSDMIEKGTASISDFDEAISSVGDSIRRTSDMFNEVYSRAVENGYFTTMNELDKKKYDKIFAGLKDSMTSLYERKGKLEGNRDEIKKSLESATKENAIGGYSAQLLSRSILGSIDWGKENVNATKENGTVLEGIKSEASKVVSQIQALVSQLSTLATVGE